MAQEINWRGGGHGWGARRKKHLVAFLTMLPFLVWEEGNPAAKDLSAGSPWAWVVSSQCSQPWGNMPSATMVAWGRNLPRPADSKASEILLIWSETQPEADIAIAPPAGTLEKDSELPGLALTSNSTILVIIFNTSHFVLLCNLHRFIEDNLGSS